MKLMIFSSSRYEGKIGRPTYHHCASRIDEVVRPIFLS
jgi:hypothetical protein